MSSTSTIQQPFKSSDKFFQCFGYLSNWCQIIVLYLFLRNSVPSFETMVLSTLSQPHTIHPLTVLVQTFKISLKKGKSEGHSSQYTLSNFLLFYRATPHATTGRAPCELMLRRPLRTILDLIKPNMGTKVNQQQGHQKYNHNTHSRGRQFDVGQ